MKKLLICLGICCTILCGIVNVSARATIEQNPYTTKKTLTGTLGSVSFTSITQYNYNTNETSVFASYSSASLSSSSYKFTGNTRTSDGSATVTYSSGNIIFRWYWNVKDSLGNTIQSGTETHTR